MLTQLTASQLAAKLQRREVSAVEVAQAHLDRIAEHDHRFRAYLTIDTEATIAEAQAAQRRLDEGGSGPLTGVPVAVKDNICTKGLRTTCASKILEHYVPPYDASVTKRLREQGLVVLGKTNLDEFAMGTSCENSAFFPSRNPWDIERSPGGSSGGSASAVAGELAPLALGSDTGGSIRMPAGLCGIVGFKPTYGRVSRYGLVAFGSSLDQIGPFARTVVDAALLAEAISGHDPMDSTSLPNSTIRSHDLKSGSLKGMKVALPREMFVDDAEPGVLDKVYAAIESLRKEGVEFTEVSIPEISLGVTTYYIIAPAEASSNLARFDGVRYGPREEGGGHVGTVATTRGRLFGHEVKARIMIGTYTLSAGYYDAYYLRAQQVRAKMARHVEDVFREFDFIMGPSSPVVAFRLGELSKDPLALKLLDTCTIPANMGGFPALSLNCGLSDGLPVGLQIMGPVMGDEKVLQAAFAVEQAMPMAQVRPPL